MENILFRVNCNISCRSKNTALLEVKNDPLGMGIYTLLYIVTQVSHIHTG